MYRSHNDISGVKALNDFKTYKVLEYLAEGYDVLHTQGENYLFEDINDFVNRRL